MIEHYNWQAALTVFLLSTALIVMGKYLVFKVPAFQRMREINIEEDRKRLAQPKYPALLGRIKWVSLGSIAVFFILVLPFCATFEHATIGKVLLEIFAILMLYDFVYYLTHRFLFHGNGPLRRVHAIHHQARDPSWIDASYVHPLEIAIGLWLFFGSVMAYTIFAGPAHVVALTVMYVLFHEVNQLNHTYFKLPYFPFKTLNWIVAKHHVHHENMHKGNYATITLFYDKIFGTLD